jgi:hypothetical protein
MYCGLVRPRAFRLMVCRRAIFEAVHIRRFPHWLRLLLCSYSRHGRTGLLSRKALSLLSGYVFSLCTENCESSDARRLTISCCTFNELSCKAAKQLCAMLAQSSNRGHCLISCLCEKACCCLLPQLSTRWLNIGLHELVEQPPFAHCCRRNDPLILGRGQWAP